jgi:hypothetical protein
MRVATFLSVAAIAAVTTIGPALAYGPATSSPSLSILAAGPETVLSQAVRQQTQVAFAVLRNGPTGYVFVRGDNGIKISNCEKRPNCTQQKMTAGSITIDCKDNGCLIVGKN